MFKWLLIIVACALALGHFSAWIANTMKDGNEEFHEQRRKDEARRAKQLAKELDRAFNEQMLKEQAKYRDKKMQEAMNRSNNE